MGQKSGSSRHEWLKKSIFSLTTVMIMLLLVELLLRILVKPSGEYYGIVLGVKLPPCNIAPPSNMVLPAWKSSQYRGSHSVRKGNNMKKNTERTGENGKEASSDDLFGIFREDELTGYTNAENSSSAHGWWYTNNVGARAEADTPRSRNKDRKRIIVFGESWDGNPGR